MKKVLLFIGGFIGAILLIAVGAIILGFPTMWLWNWLAPSIFGLGKISVWKAIGLNILCSFWFKTGHNYKNLDEAIADLKAQINKLNQQLNNSVYIPR